MVDLWHFNIFCKVVEYKSFSKAAKAVHISQPTVSSHIRDMEEHFDCRLIDRLSKEVVPTKAGEVLYDYARRLIILRDETLAAMSEFLGTVKGRLVIGGSTIPGVHIIPPIISSFIKAYPKVIISLVIGDTEKIIEDIISGIIDFGIVGAEYQDIKLIQEKLIEDQMRLVIPANHKWADKDHISPEALLKEPFIIREYGSGTLKSFLKSLNSAGYDVEHLNIIAQMGSTGAVIQGIKNNIGISVVSAIAVADEVAAGILKTLTIDGLNMKRNFYITCLKNRTPSPQSKAFIAFLKENI